MSLSTTDIFKMLCHKNKNLIQLNDAELKKVQEQLLSMADDIIGVLEEENCVYHLTGGSALGAVRHQGFIPWDDDIDIDISREDYSKFMSCFKNKFGYKYWIHNAYSDDMHCLPSNQIRLKDTIYMSVNDYSEKECGLPIDIVIMENTFDNVVLRKIHGIGSLALGLIVSCRKFYQYKDYFNELVKDLPNERKIFQRKINIGMIFSFFSLRRWTIFYDKWNSICKNNHSKYVVVPTGRKHFFGELYERDKFYKTRRENFCGRDWKIPYDYDYYLKKLYGDYMKIPKEHEKHALLKMKI